MQGSRERCGDSLGGTNGRGNDVIILLSQKNVLKLQGSYSIRTGLNDLHKSEAHRFG